MTSPDLYIITSTSPTRMDHVTAVNEIGELSKKGLDTHLRPCTITVVRWHREDFNGTPYKMIPEWQQVGEPFNWPS